VSMGGRAVSGAWLGEVQAAVGATQEQRQRAHHRQVAPIFAGEDLSHNDGKKGERKAQIGTSRHRGPDLGRNQHADPSECPEKD
jgi:hypothetical protein